MSVADAVPLRALFRVSWPARWYWARFERQLGKQVLVDGFLKRLLPAPPAGFEAELAGGGRVWLHHREDIGLVVLLNGAFEPAETACARTLARVGTTAIDVGANVGMFTVPLALAVGELGQVIAIEPAPGNVARLTRNLDQNDLQNVVVRDVAVGAQAGSTMLRLGADPAFHSTTAVVKSRGGEGERLPVAVDTLDGIWSAAGRPEVSLVKVDTEGGELDVVRGATELLQTQRPAILVEAKHAARVRELDEILSPFGYGRTRPRGFAKGNYLYA